MGAAMTLAAAFKKKGSKASSLADLVVSGLSSSQRTSDSRTG